MKLFITGVFLSFIFAHPEDSSSHELLHIAVIGFIVLGFMYGLTTWLSGYIMGSVGEKLNVRLRMDVYKNLMKQDVSYYEDTNHSIGKLTARLATDSTNVQAAVDQRLADILNGVTSVFIGLGVGIYFGYQVALLCSLVSIPFIVAQHLLLKSVKKRTSAETHLENRISKITSESISKVKTIQKYTRAKVSAGIIFNMLKEKPKIDNFSEGGLKPDIKGNLELKEVDFSYPNGMHTLTLNKISMKANFGQTVAIVGASGCGKSTIIQLIERFYDVLGGKLLIDGQDIRQINIQHLRSSMALVGQEPTLFNLSIRENISYGLENISLEKIKAAAKLANKLVQEALDKLKDGRMCLVVAHRLSTIQNADLIYILENGKVVEVGNHQQLLERKGLYYRLVESQSIN
ncbi:hypothetical protein FO519_009331 [Halicephalobus sp. NKZ332]|nr:hypothetical protein FO519_009331 [Halicephalobus sp. NKZ332]